MGEIAFIISDEMFLSRGRAFVGHFFKIAQSSLIETGPRVSAVKLMHTIQFYNNGQYSTPIVD